MTRKLALLLLGAVLLLTVGLDLVGRSDEHLYLDHPSLFEFVAPLGMIMLLIAFVLILFIYLRLSLRMAPAVSFAIGVSSFCIGFGIARVLGGHVNTHGWTVALLVLPAILLSDGFITVLISSIRLVKSSSKEN